jgi:hypothetical protein
MRHAPKRRLAAVLVSMTAVFATFVGVGLAKSLGHETFHEEGTFVEEDFCGAGFTVNGSFVADGRASVFARGKAGLIYFMDHATVENTLTANGVTIHDHIRIISKDLHVTDNGDGTLTIIFFQTGNAVLYGPDGKAIARNPGQVRFEVVVDHGGTPDDPEDDTEVSFELIKGSTGRSDDFCAAAVAAFTGA